jgi:hypothetical protein
VTGSTGQGICVVIDLPVALEDAALRPS